MSQLKFIYVFLGALVLSCSSVVKESFPPNPRLVDKTFCVLLVQPPPGVPFYLDTLNRLVWRLNEGSPWFRQQLLGVSQAVPQSNSLTSLLSVLEDSLRSRADLLMIVYAKQFVWNSKSDASIKNSSTNQDDRTIDEARLFISLVDLKQNKDVGSFHVNVIRRRTDEDSLLELLAYQIAVKAGFGWQVEEKENL